MIVLIEKYKEPNFPFQFIILVHVTFDKALQDHFWRLTLQWNKNITSELSAHEDYRDTLKAGM